MIYNNNLNSLKDINSRISILEMIEKIKNGGIVWQRTGNFSWKTIQKQDGDIWEMVISRQQDNYAGTPEFSESKNLTSERVVLDFKKNNNHYFSIDSYFDSNIFELYNELAGDDDYLKDKLLLLDLNNQNLINELGSRTPTIYSIQTSGGLVASNIILRIFDEFSIGGIKLTRTSSDTQIIYPVHKLNGPRGILVHNDKVFIANEGNPECVVVQLQNEQGASLGYQYKIEGNGWLNVIQRSFNLEVNYNKKIELSHPSFSLCRVPLKGERGVPGSLKKKLYSIGFHSLKLDVVDTEKLVVTKTIDLDLGACAIDCNINIYHLYVAETKLDLNNKNWRWDLLFGPDYPDNTPNLTEPIVPKVLSEGPPYRTIQDVPVGVQGKPSVSKLTVIDIRTEEEIDSVDFDECSFSDMIVDLNTNFIYLADAGNNKVYALDPLRNFQIMNIFETGEMPISLQIIRNQLYCVNAKSNNVEIFELASWQKIGTINSPWNHPVKIRINSKTSLAYLALYGEYGFFGNSIAVIDTWEDKIVKFINVGFGPWDIDLDESANVLYVTNYLSNNTTAVDLSNDALNFFDPRFETINITPESFGLKISGSAVLKTGREDTREMSGGVSIRPGNLSSSGSVYVSKIPVIVSPKRSVDLIKFCKAISPASPDIFVFDDNNKINCYGTINATTPKYISFSVSSSKQLSYVDLKSLSGGDGVAFFAIQAGSFWSAGLNTNSMLAYGHISASNLNTNLLNTLTKQATLPLSSGFYTIWMNQTGSSITNFRLMIGLI